MRSPVIAYSDDGIARLSGEVTFNTAGALYRNWQNHSRESSRPGAIDLEAVELIDSAGLALLLEWQSAATKTDASSPPIRIVNAPAALLKIARLCEAEKYLRLDQDQKAAPAR